MKVNVNIDTKRYPRLSEDDLNKWINNVQNDIAGELYHGNKDDVKMKLPECFNFAPRMVDNEIVSIDIVKNK